MTTRIHHCFEELRAKGRKGFIAYICAGDPGLDETVDTVLRLEEAGADIVELGIPFSDPLADGVVNQFASARALEAGTTVSGVLKAVEKIRSRSRVPLVIMTYVNPVYAWGYQAFARDASEAGVDGLLMTDLPVEESDECADAVHAHNLDNIYLVAPTSTDERIDRICHQGSGFIYCVSREGVTGMQDQISGAASELLKKTRSRTDLPIALGFGVSTTEQARAAVQHGDAVIVGSAIVNRLYEEGNSPAGRERATSWVAELVQAAKSVASSE
jgi:tryptophan synthase alpha chain